MLGELFCRNLEDINVKGKAEDTGLGFEFSAGNFKTLSRPVAILDDDSVVLVRWNEESAVTNKIPEI